jgi:hypothetical protein
VTFSLLGAQKLVSGKEDIKIKKNAFSNFVFLPIQIESIEIENPKNPKIDSPYCRLLSYYTAV